METPKGKRMIDSREQFELMARLYERALLREKDINSKLRVALNDARNKLERNNGKGKRKD